MRKPLTGNLSNFVELRKLRKNDLKMLRFWRNANRKFFFNKDVVSPKMQINWYYDRYLKNPNDTIYIVLYKNVPVGTLAMIKHDNGELEIGRVMLGEKKYARKGIMGKALELLLKLYEENNTDMKRFFLEVIRTNKSAIEFYEKHGFKQIEEKADEIVMTKDI